MSKSSYAVFFRSRHEGVATGNKLRALIEAYGVVLDIISLWKPRKYN